MYQTRRQSQKQNRLSEETIKSTLHPTSYEESKYVNRPGLYETKAQKRLSATAVFSPPPTTTTQEMKTSTYDESRTERHVNSPPIMHKTRGQTQKQKRLSAPAVFSTTKITQDVNSPSMMSKTRGQLQKQNLLSASPVISKATPFGLDSTPPTKENEIKTFEESKSLERPSTRGQLQKQKRLSAPPDFSSSTTTPSIPRELKTNGRLKRTLSFDSNNNNQDRNQFPPPAKRMVLEIKLFRLNPQVEAKNILEWDVGNQLKQAEEKVVTTYNNTSPYRDQFYLGSYMKNMGKSVPTNYKKMFVEYNHIASGCDFCRNASRDVSLPLDEIVLVHEKVRNCLRNQNKFKKSTSDCPLCIFVAEDLRNSKIPKNQKTIHLQMTWCVQKWIVENGRRKSLEN